jgi:hypothetical protein
MKAKRREGGETVETLHLGGGGQGTIFPVLKVPRQCPLVRLVEAMHMVGINFYITLEGLHYSEFWFNIGRATLGRNSDVTIGRAACEACGAKWNLRTNSAFAWEPNSRSSAKKFRCLLWNPNVRSLENNFLYLFRGLYNVSSYNTYIASNGRWMVNLKGFGKKWSWPIFRYYPSIYLEEMG